MVIHNTKQSKIHKIRKKYRRRAETRVDIEEELIKNFKNVMTEDQLKR